MLLPAQFTSDSPFQLDNVRCTAILESSQHTLSALELIHLQQGLGLLQFVLCCLVFILILKNIFLVKCYNRGKSETNLKFLGVFVVQHLEIRVFVERMLVQTFFKHLNGVDQLFKGFIFDFHVLHWMQQRNAIGEPLFYLL